ncbi:MAG: Fibronectin type III domain protein [Parcubacteria group bacterium GW2011_GWB1_56_8]|nr:MAG: Fibronectin type III domain protein [Parcubacteria group bacterium GW2011_GWB1_56_8]
MPDEKPKKHGAYKRAARWIASIFAFALAFGLFSFGFLNRTEASVTNNGRLLYGDMTNPGVLKFGTYTAPFTFTTSTTGISTQASGAAFIIAKSSVTRNEIMVGQLLLSGRLDIFVASSGADVAADYSRQWNVSSSPAMTCGGTSAVDCTRTFDLAYERLSGRGMVVYATTTSNGGALYYRLWNGSSWTNPATISLSSAGRPTYVTLKAKPKSNEMLLGVSVDVANVHEVEAFRWDGSAWVDGVLATDVTDAANSTQVMNTGNVVDVEWESLSEDALVVWGAPGATGATKYKLLYNGSSSWTGEQTGPASPGGNGAMLTMNLDADPTSNRIAYTYTDSANDSAPGIWKADGSTPNWTMGNEDGGIEAGPTLGTQYADIIWQNSTSTTTSTAMWVAHTGGTTVDTEHQTATCNSSGCAFSPIVTTMPTAGGDDGTFIRLAQAQNEDDLFVLWSTVDRNLYAQHWNGSDWEAAASADLASGTLSPASAVSGTCSGTICVAHMSAAMAYIPYRPWSMNWRLYSGTSTADTPSPALAAENTSSSVAMTGGQVRLRFNMIAPQGGTDQTDTRKKLQFTTSTTPDASSSTWTDVGNIGSSTAWRYFYCDTGSSVCNDGTVVASTTLSSSTVAGWWNTSKDAAASSSMDHASTTIVELEFPIETSDAEASTGYYFRMYDTDQESPVLRFQATGTTPCASNSACKYPAIVTGAAIPITTLADGTNPGNVTIAPEATATSSDAFTFRTNSGTDVVTAVTVGLTSNSTSGISKVEITNETSSIVYGSSTDPTADSFSITLNQNTLTATTATTTYKIRLTPKSHTSMPPVPGSEYAVTSTILSFTPTSNASSGTDGTSATITIDNLSPDNVSATSTAPGDSQIELSWTNPGSDFSNVVIIRATSTPTGTPDEGSSPSVDGPLGNGIVRYISNGASTTDTGLTNGTTYYYKIFAKDTNGNYSQNGVQASATPTAVPPQISAAANETFSVGDGVTAISAITVSSTAASQITAADDIRIKLATSTGAPDMKWDTNDTLAVITGSASSSASTTVSYADASTTLIVNVLSDFSSGQNITISGLGYRDFNSVNTATTTRDVIWQGASQSPPYVRDAKTVTIKGRLEANQHSSGQETNQFTATSTASDKELFAFQILPTGEAASTTLVIQLSSVSGIATADVTSTRIFVDANANGTIDAGETSTAFGLGSVDISGETGTITFNTSSTVASATSTRYILKATTTSLLADDTMTVGLGASDVTADGQTIGLRLTPTSTSAISNAVHTVPAVSRTQRSWRWLNDNGATVNANTAIADADAAISDVKIGERLTLRVQLDNDGGGESAGIQYRLQYQVNGTSSSWSDVAGGSAIEPSLGLAGADGAAITSAVAAASSRIFTAGTWHENTGVSGGGTALPNSGYTELGFMIDTANAASSTTYYFRAANNTGPTDLDAYSSYPSLSTIASSSHLVQYSKTSGSLPAATSSLIYFFDNLDYASVASDDAAYATTTASANIPLFLFRVKNATSSHPLKLTWKGQYSAASTTFMDVYRFGAANAWQTLISTSTPSVNTDFTLAANLTTSTSEYYEADGANYWVYFRLRQGTTTGSLLTNYVNADFVPTMDSAADQTFQVNDAPTSASQITIKASRTPVATAANDIRIQIPSALNMKWATSTTVATLGGSASSSASTTVSYPDEKTLLVNVTSNFAAEDDLVISGLNFANFTAASASTTLQAFYYGTSTNAPYDAVDSKIRQIRGKYDVASHAVGQESNKFDIEGTSLNAAELLAFQIFPTGENATTSQLVIDLFEVAGFVSSSIANAELVVDTGADGSSSGDTQTVGGAGTVSEISSGSGTITFDTAFNTTTTLNLILRADVSSINHEDVMKLRVQPSGITATGQTSKISLVPSGSSPQAIHAKPSIKGGGGPSEGPPPGVGNQGGGGPGGGGGGTDETPPATPPVGGGSPGGGDGAAP